MRFRSRVVTWRIGSNPSAFNREAAASADMATRSRLSLTPTA